MRDPLKRRIPREIRSEAGKYIVIFIFMVALIGVASGYFIADASLKVAYDESFETYNIEDGFLEFAEKPDEALLEACEEEGITLFDNTFKDEPCDNGSTVRLFRIREEVNIPCLLDGALPEAKDEIALDRLYMKSNGIKQGDTITLDGEDYRITGTIALPDYSALYKNVTDFMFDTEKFGVSVVTPEGFDKAPVPTENETAERFAAGSLKIVRGDFSEEVSVYGIIEDSSYFHSEIGSGTVEISSAYADKYRLKEGDSITLEDEYGGKEYTFDISGIYDYPSSLVVFMDISFFNETFGNDEDYFSGYFSDSELDDIDEKLIASEITEDEVTKTSRQLKRSMGNMMIIFVVLGISVIVLVVYLLSKVMIEKNAQSISVAKILGYEPREISGIYLRTTTIVTIVSFLLCIPLEGRALDWLWRTMMMEYPGWLAPDVPASAYIKTVAIGIATYLVTTFLLKRRIERIPMDEALKNVE